VLASAMTIAVMFGAGGCATSMTASGASTIQKLHDDEAALKQFESDVKTQCGPQFAPLAATAGAILGIAEGIAAAASGNISVAIQAAVAAFPVVAADVAGMRCVYSVVTADYQKFKPTAAKP